MPIIEHDSHVDHVRPRFAASRVVRLENSRRQQRSATRSRSSSFASLLPVAYLLPSPHPRFLFLLFVSSHPDQQPQDRVFFPQSASRAAAAAVLLRPKKMASGANSDRLLARDVTSSEIENPRQPLINGVISSESYSATAAILP
ncbi:hypothetical protein BHE74_00017885 [Ensete ventricosum]|nr:hypothetical protein GW17_00030706 [Ensete ventricosum]RWW74201.1 hypothetical protein BHE74_00017885 [Ensete ventricosum]RZS04249.1 hypothetical protein BHM03_00034557 [Ensete ventricosum]